MLLCGEVSSGKCRNVVLCFDFSWEAICKEGTRRKGEGENEEGRERKKR